MRKDYGSYDYVVRVKKVKHVKLFEAWTAKELETMINNFADENPSFKILGIRIAFNPVSLQPTFFASVTYLENGKDGLVEEDDNYGSYEERDTD